MRVAKYDIGEIEIEHLSSSQSTLFFKYRLNMRRGQWFLCVLLSSAIVVVPGCRNNSDKDNSVARDVSTTNTDSVDASPKRARLDSYVLPDTRPSSSQFDAHPYESRLDSRFNTEKLVGIQRDAGVDTTPVDTRTDANKRIAHSDAASQPDARNSFKRDSNNGNASLPIVTSFPIGNFVKIEPSTIILGSPSSEEGRGSNEEQYEATIEKAFWMQETEVTQSQWKSIMHSNPSRFIGCGPNCPVDSVGWFDAAYFLNKLSQSEGLEACYILKDCIGTPGAKCPAKENGCSNAYECSKNSRLSSMDCRGYRLPTEAEWEYAARAKTTTSSYAGQIDILGEFQSKLLDGIAWFGGNSKTSSYDGATCPPDPTVEQFYNYKCGSHPVKLKTPNAFGLYDIIGNVAEWTNDRYFHNPSPEKRTESDNKNSENDSKTVRGGSWFGWVTGMRAANRGGFWPATRSSKIGFRIAKTDQ